MRLQEAAVGREGLKGYLVLPDLLKATQKGTMEPIKQLTTALRHIQGMSEHRRASALEEVVGGTEGEIITGLFRRGKVDEFIKALETSTGTIYEAGQAMDRFWSILTEVQQVTLAFGYALFNSVAPALEPIAAIALNAARGLKWLFLNTGVVAKFFGGFLLGSVILLGTALISLAVKQLTPLAVAYGAQLAAVLTNTLQFLGLNVAMAPLVGWFLALAVAIGGLLLLLNQIPGLNIGNPLSNITNSVTQNNTFNVEGGEGAALEINDRLGVPQPGNAYAVAGRF